MASTQRSTKKDPVQELRDQVEKEIAGHVEWCGPNCQTFLPGAYREARMISGHAAKTVQNDYDLCHIFR